MIKVIPGETISRTQPAPDKTIIRIQALDIETKEQIDYFEFVLIYVSYRKDQRLPKDKKKLNIKTKIQMRNKKGDMISVTFKKNSKEVERAEIALKWLFVKDGRYELGSISEAVEVLNEQEEATNE